MRNTQSNSLISFETTTRHKGTKIAIEYQVIGNLLPTITIRYKNRKIGAIIKRTNSKEVLIKTAINILDTSSNYAKGQILDLNFCSND